MEAVCSSETLVYIYKPTRCHNPDDLNLNNLLYENPTAYIYAGDISRECHGKCNTLTGVRGEDHSVVTWTREQVNVSTRASAPIPAPDRCCCLC
jgi:hypothetical protein